MALILLLGGLAPSPARTDGPVGIADVRAAIESYLAGFPAPTTKAATKFKAALESAVAALAVADAGDLCAKVKAFEATVKKLAKQLGSDPAFLAAVDGALDTYATDLAGAIDGLRAGVNGLPKKTGAAAKKLLDAADRAVAAARKLDAKDVARVKKLLAACKSFDKGAAVFCPRLSHVGEPPVGRTTLSEPGGGIILPGQVSILSPIALVTTEASGFGAESGGNVYAVARGSDYEFRAYFTGWAPGAKGYALDGATITLPDGAVFRCTIGSLFVTSSKLIEYAGGHVSGAVQHYVSMKGYFTGRADELGGTRQMSGILVEFDFCEIPYSIQR